ncbi:MAG: beta-phosphoglucomutase [Lachnospiraceae bacterium]|nr:beta-phosphoglucomutase [Lachnospiraceae bacterium]
MNEKIEGIIFDLDGVICSTDQYHYQAWKSLADSLGIYFDKKINDRLRGVSRAESLEIVLENSDKVYSDEQKAALAERKNDMYVQLIRQMTPDDLSDDVRMTLQELRRRGYRLAIGSSSKNTRTILRQIGLGDFFDAVSDGTNITHSKPDPEVFLKAAEMLRLNAGSCIVVQDARAGIEAAANGHFYSAGVGEAATDPRVTWPIRKISDLLGIVNSQSRS